MDRYLGAKENPGKVASKSAGSVDMTTSSGRKISYYVDEIPPFVEAELDRLYQAIFSSLPKLKIFGAPNPVSTYAVTRQDAIVTLLLFQCSDRNVSVLNEFIVLDQAEINEFADFIFFKFPTVQTVSFSAIKSDFKKLNYPSQKFHNAEDIVANLPDTFKEYQSNLGKNLRSAINSYERKIKREYPSFEFQIVETGEVQEHQLWKIYNLHNARLDWKGKTSNLTAGEMAKINELVKARGLLGFATIDGEICGGLICWRAGNNFFMRIIAHNPDYDKFRLGKLCCAFTIRECIARGGKQFHFGWGRLEYKYRFLGKEIEFDRIEVYRSSMHLLRNSRMAAAVGLKGLISETRLWLLNAEQKKTRKERIAVGFVKLIRSIKRLLPSH